MNRIWYWILIIIIVIWNLCSDLITEWKKEKTPKSDYGYNTVYDINYRWEYNSQKGRWEPRDKSRMIEVPEHITPKEYMRKEPEPEYKTPVVDKNDPDIADWVYDKETKSFKRRQDTEQNTRS